MDLGFLGGFESYGKEYKRHPTKIIWANELNSNACETYKRNISKHIRQGNIWDAIHSFPEQVDVVLGGFPCQDISVNNRNAMGVNGKRSGLYRAMVEAIKKSSPRIFVAENVKALLNANHKESLKQVIKDFSDLGYNVSYQLYNAASYGVSQTRERVIIVGTKEGKFEHPAPILDKSAWIPVKDVIDDLAELPKDPDWSHMWSLAKNGACQGNRRLIAERPGYTMRAECHGNTHYHYRLPRRISMREGARIQSFPDDFIFVSKMRETERQIGNAVPPVLAWHVANEVVAFLNDAQTPLQRSQYELDFA